MKIRLTVIATVLLLPLMLSCSSLEGSGTSSTQPSPTTDAVAPTNVNLMDTDCGQLMEGLVVADPGTNPSAERLQEAIDAQDDIAAGLMWVHGYLAGRSSSNTAPQPLTQEWMVVTVGRLAAVCKNESADGKMTIAEAVEKL